MPQKTEAPYLCYFEIYRDKNYTYGGYNGTSIISIQISAYAPSRDLVRLIADQVSLSMVAWPKTNNKIGYAYQENEVSAWRDDLDLYEIDIDFNIFHTD